MLEILLIYLALGSVAGVLAGLLGIGGGVVLVPGLLAAFALQGVEPAKGMHAAVATSLACIVLTAVSSIRAHHARGSVDWPVVARLAPGLLIGSLGGAVLADAIDGATLQMIFGVAALILGGRMLLLPAGADQGDRPLPGAVPLAFAGGGIGSLSTLIGIGGGSLTVPFLSWFRMPMVRAVGTSAACGLPIALAGTAGFIWTGWSAPDRFAYSAGYVLLPAVVGISIASVATAPLGARLAHLLPAQRLKRAFGGVLVVVGLRLVGVL